MLWKADTGARLANLEWQAGTPKTLAVSADGQTLAWPDSYHWWVSMRRVSDLLRR
jgi:hypothetical protein